MRLHGITWEHPRGVLPLRATAARFRREHPEADVSWQARSLEDFEEQPVAELAERYDLVMVDHPLIGAAVASSALAPLDELLPAGFLAEQRAHAVGPSYDSYTWEGQQWALAVDAAAQVAAYRGDLLERLGVPLPRSWHEVAALAAAFPQRVAMPLNPTHLWCSVLALQANLGGAPGESADEVTAWLTGTGPGAAGRLAEALGLLYGLLDRLHPLSPAASPIRLLEAMSRGDEIAYAPLVFGYCSYAREREGRAAVRFGPVPSFVGQPRGAVLGGVGLAVSRACRQPRLAAAYARLVASPECQRGLYVDSGGQPGHRAAWTDPAVDRAANGFFSATLETLELAAVRPRSAGYPRFQRQAARALHDLVAARAGAGEVSRALAALWAGRARPRP